MNTQIKPMNNSNTKQHKMKFVHGESFELPFVEGLRVQTCELFVSRLVIKHNKYYLLIQWSDSSFVKALTHHVKTQIEHDPSVSIGNGMILIDDSSLFVFDQKDTVDNILLFDQHNHEISFSKLRKGTACKAIIEWKNQQWRLLQLQAKLTKPHISKRLRKFVSTNEKKTT